jgi:hypothetical protein
MEFLLLLQASNANIIAAYWTSNHRLAIEIGWWSIILISKDKILCQLYSKNVVENDAHFVLKCPLYNSTRFPSLSSIVVLVGSLKSLFWFNYQIDISLCLTQVNALHYSREIAILTPSWCTFSPMSILTFLTLESISSHWNKKRWEFLLSLNELWLYTNQTTQLDKGSTQFKLGVGSTIYY